MRKLIYGFICAGLTFVSVSAFAQTAKPSFEVASVKPAAPVDMQKMAAAMQSGGDMPKMGPHIDGARAEYTYMALRDLIMMAYKVKPFQITGPDWLVTTRFDIMAKMPAGSTKDDAPQMLQALLEERFKMTVHRETKERPVLALVLGKGGSKMKELEVAKPIDEDAPLKQGQVQMETAEGPARMTIDPKGGGATVDMGAKGKYTYKLNPGTMTMHMEAQQVTMGGFADMLTQFSQMSGAGSKFVVDMTELKGSYEVAIDFSMADLIAMARSQGMDVPGGTAGGAASSTPGANAATEPGGGTSITDAVAALGLKLEQRKAPVEQLVVDHIEKAPTGN